MKQKYFMGASTGCGFKTEFYNEHKDYYGYFIKGGPGTGKSTMMKRIAEDFSKENISVYSCSSDPDSVDAIVFEDKRIFFADATPPHESNPKLPFVTGEIIDLATGLDASKLNDVKEEAVYLNNQNKACHNTASKYLSIIGDIQGKIMEIGKEHINTEKTKKVFWDLYDEYFEGNISKTGKSVCRQRIAYTPHGKKCFFPDNCRIIVLKDDFLYSGFYILNKIKEKASSDGFYIEETKTMTQNLFAENMLCFPEINFAVCAEQNLPAELIKTEQIINLDEVYDKEMQKDVKAFADYQLKVIKEMEEKTVSVLFDALKIHDDLEKLYIDAIDKEWLNNKFFEIKNKI